jgi:N-acetylglucosaminyl-diphospho-decaprenol L-rhamnosyltransferase
LPESGELTKTDVSGRVGAVVVNYNAGAALARCVESLRESGIGDIVVVDNGSNEGSSSPGQAGEVPELPVRLIAPPRNLGYGAGANLGARNSGFELLFICNPDLVVQPGAVARLAQALDARPDAALAGPMLLDPHGSVYPSGRSFPGLGDALGHGFAGLFWRNNPWTRRYRLLGADQHRARDADWVSGAAFLVRRRAFEAVGGFDESYFMYVEDVDLCWRLHRAGWAVLYEASAHVVHEQGRSTSRHPYRMLAAHHHSILRFAARSTSGRERLLLPLVTVALAARLALACLRCFAVGVRNDRSAARAGSPGPGAGGVRGPEGGAG